MRHKPRMSNELRQQQAVTQLLQQGRQDEAWRKIRAHLTLVPYDSWFLHEAARLARRNGELELAQRYYQRALKVTPQDAGLLNGLGLTHYDAGRFSEAESCYQAALKAHTHYAACHNNYAILLHKQHRYHAALAQYRLALHIKPDYTKARYGMSTLLAHMGQLPEAESLMQQVLRERRSDRRCRNALGMVQLQQGNFSAGWRNYQARYALDNPDRFFSLPTLPFPYWQGEDLRGKTLLVRTEQGLGDEIQFCRFLSRVKTEKQADKVLMLGSNALKPLMATLAHVDGYLVREDKQHSLPKVDYWCSLLDLPQHFLDSPQPFGAEHPYLFSSTEQQEQWPIAGTGKKIGVVWKGSSGHKNDIQRSLAHLSQLAPLFDLPNTHWISLQKGAGEEEVIDFPQVQPYGARFSNYQDTAAVISQLDLVIGVDTSVIHLAGALGKPCWVLLPAWARDWRWLAGREDSPWYPQMRLFARGQDEEWSDVIARVKHALQP
ncbi:glycosyltransferase family protein [Pantoea sp. BIGb0393]|uniref:Tetratricopeptide repeat-containing glycosyltransferase family protein n=1 Tax=Pantoea nemavictus TaxID=2726955 RepID=A0ABU8PQ85_9GAMM|nr:tetratricopeptide repeat-containing glycosyltransferase family protein [Pantoea nemavictus]MBA0035906.1 glycosyltransferase family protein [Pantoea nemavictus]